MTHSPDSPVPPGEPPASGPASAPPGPHAMPGEAGGQAGTAAPDRAEIEGVIARDPVALGRFFERWFDRVFGLAYRLLGDRAMAEDITQDVFLRVHRAAHTLDPERDPGPWMMTITHNLCRDVWRSGAYRMARASAPLDDPHGVAATLGGPGDTPEVALLRKERERLVREALQSLPEPLRVAVVLHDWAGLGHEEIGRLTGIEHAAARKRYSRALTALARTLRGTLG